MKTEIATCGRQRSSQSSLYARGMAALFLIAVLPLLEGCPMKLSEGKSGSSAASSRNVYLEAVVEWNPQPAGSGRAGWLGVVDGDGMPIQNDRAL